MNTPSGNKNGEPQPVAPPFTFPLESLDLHDAAKPLQDAEIGRMNALDELVEFRGLGMLPRLASPDYDDHEYPELDWYVGLCQYRIILGMDHTDEDDPEKPPKEDREAVCLFLLMPLDSNWEDLEREFVRRERWASILTLANEPLNERSIGELLDMQFGATSRRKNELIAGPDSRQAGKPLREFPRFNMEDFMEELRSGKMPTEPPDPDEPSE